MISIKTIFITACACMLSATVLAQNTDEVKQQIAKVKKSSQYIYADAVAATAEDAAGLAEELLYDEIKKWGASMKKLQGKSIIVGDTKKYHSSLSLPRGNMFRTFIYVKKSDLTAVDNASVSISPQESEVKSQEPSSVQSVWPDVVTTIASYTEYAPMAAKIKELKIAGKIGHYARYGNLERPEIYYLVIYDQQGNVLTVLSPGKERTNVKTGKVDTLTNYSGCGAIGLTVK